MKKEQMKMAWEKFLAAMDNEYKYKKILEKFENMIIWQQDRLGRTREEATMDIYSQLNYYAQGKCSMFSKFDINKTEDHWQLSYGMTAFKQVYFHECVCNDGYNKKKNWEDITAILMDNPLLRYNVDKNWVKNTIEANHTEFLKCFKREPEQKPEDIKWLMDNIMNKLNRKCMNDLKPCMNKVNEMKNFIKEMNYFDEKPNENAFNYSIWVVFIVNRSGNVNHIDVETLAHEVRSMYYNFEKHFNY